ncbi:MAG: phosphotransferase [Thermodesulfobacteria bacterium]|nr:phosphotransferase [Thermodesulfobacteriota bacterium]
MPGSSSKTGEGLPREVLPFLKRSGLYGAEVVPLAGDGSNRRFFRLRRGKDSFVLVLPQPGDFGLKEAEAYVTIGLFLRRKGIPVPRIFDYEKGLGLILLEDLGDQRLEDLRPEARRKFYPQAVELLVRFQEAREGFEPQMALEGPYDASLMWEREALYFLESFVKGHLRVVPPRELIEELREIWEEAKAFLEEEVLLHRDFQSRNLMIKDGKLRLIDFQGTRLGPPDYDLASLLIDPYAALGAETKKELFDLYLRLSGRPALPGYGYFALFRNLQILGAFAKLTRLGKTWFEGYIPQALKGLCELVREHFSERKGLLRFLEDVEKDQPFVMV